MNGSWLGVGTGTRDRCDNSTETKKRVSSTQLSGANETKYRLRIVAATVRKIIDDARNLWREADEPHKILSDSFRTADKAQTQKKAFWTLSIGH